RSQRPSGSTLFPTRRSSDLFSPVRYTTGPLSRRVHERCFPKPSLSVRVLSQDAPKSPLRHSAELCSTPVRRLSCRYLRSFRRRKDRKSTRLNSSHVKISYAV